jgi:phosphatidylserine/phosphatidylglycerophosphate/cardiolipin synthase-like enzyme
MSGATDPSALHYLHDRFGQVRISSLGRLHAKVYLIDGRVDIITSANVTAGGLRANFEYGVRIDDRKAIAAIRKDMRSSNHFTQTSAITWLTE